MVYILKASLPLADSRLEVATGICETTMWLGCPAEVPRASFFRWSMVKLAEVYRLRAQACERLAMRSEDPVVQSDYRFLAQHWRSIARQMLAGAPISELGLGTYRAYIETRVLH